MITIRNVSKRFKSGAFSEFTAVDDVTFSVDEGSILGIAGNSGCGKSTLARMIVGLEHSSKGTIQLEGTNIDDLSRKEISRRVQIIFQHPESSLDPKVKIKYSLMEPQIINGVCNREEAEKRIRALMKIIGLNEILFDRYPHQISGGEAQRVAIARVLSLEPKIIVFDEPTSMLDVSVQASILTLLQDLQSRFNLTYIVISHDLEVLSRICDELIIMKNGKVVDVGKTSEVIGNPKSDYTKELVENFRFFEEE